MSKIKYFLIAIMAIFLASCKGKPSPIKPGSTSLQGDLATYYEVVDKEYTFIGYGDITIDFKKVKDGLPAPWHSSMKYGPYSDPTYYQLKFTITFLDENGNILEEKELGSEASEKLANLQNGDSTKVVLSWIGKSARRKAKTFTVTGTFERGEQSRFSSSSESTEPSTEMADAISEISTEESTEDNSSSSSEDYDAVLDEYEEYTNKLLSMLKKVEAGDMSAYADYMGLVESRTSLDKKLANAKKEMTTAQAARFLRIQAKYLKAISKA